MERKEDLILECFVLKGKGLDWLAVIYLEEETTLKAFSRTKIADQSFQIRFLGGADRQRLSKTLFSQFQEAADRCGLAPIHLVYPGGVRERAFLQGLRETKKEGDISRERSKN